METKTTSQPTPTPIRSTLARYGRGALAAAIGCAFILLIAGYKPMAKGVVLGTLFSILNFILIGRALPRQIGHSRGKATVLALGSIVGRFSLMAVPLILAIKLDALNLPATIAGLFMVQVVILAEQSWQFFRTPRKTRA